MRTREIAHLPVLLIDVAGEIGRPIERLSAVIGRGARIRTTVGVGEVVAMEGASASASTSISAYCRRELPDAGLNVLEQRLRGQPCFAPRTREHFGPGLQPGDARDNWRSEAGTALRRIRVDHPALSHVDVPVGRTRLLLFR